MCQDDRVRVSFNSQQYNLESPKGLPRLGLSGTIYVGNCLNYTNFVCLESS